MRRSLGRASLLLLGSNWAHGGLGVIVSLMIARGLGPEAVGDLAVNLGLASLVMAALLPGFGRAHLKRLAEGQDAGRCVGTMLALQTAMTALMLLILGLGVALGWLPPVSTGLVFIFMLSAQLTSRFAEAFQQVFLAREAVLTHGLVLVTARLARLGATVVVLTAEPRVEWIAATFWLESVILAAGAALVLVLRDRVRVHAPSVASLTAYWTYARPFLVTTPISLVQDSIDRVLVGRWAGLTAAGYYHVARGLWEALASVMAPPGLFLFTRLSSLYVERTAERDRAARELFARTLDRLLFVTVPLGLVLWALAEVVIGTLYGAAFVPAVTALRVLVLAALAANVVSPYTFVAQAQDEVGRFVPVSVARLAGYLVVLATLVAFAGSRWLSGLTPEAGAAGARLFLALFPAWVYVRWARELAGIPFWRRAWVYGACFGVAVAVYHAALAAVDQAVGGGATADVAATLAGGAVYALLLVRTHPEARLLARQVAELLSPQGMLTTLRGRGDTRSLC